MCSRPAVDRLAAFGAAQQIPRHWMKTVEEAFEEQIWYWRAPGSGVWLSTGRALWVSGRKELSTWLQRQVANIT